YCSPCTLHSPVKTSLPPPPPLRAFLFLRQRLKLPGIPNCEIVIVFGRMGLAGRKIAATSSPAFWQKVGVIRSQPAVGLSLGLPPARFRIAARTRLRRPRA